MSNEEVFEQIATSYAVKIRAAAMLDRRTIKKASITEAVENNPRTVKLTTALEEVGDDLEGQRYDDGDPLSEEDKQEICAKTAARLDFPPRRLRRVLKEASVQNFLAILADIEALSKK